MVRANIILDTRRITANGYPVKIQIKSKYIHLGIYQNFKTLKFTSEIRNRQIKLDNEVRYCNENNLSFEDSIKIIKNGVNDEIEVFLLEKKLRELKSISSVGILDFFDTIIKEKESKKESVSFYKQTQKQISNFIIEDLPINSITYEWVNSFILYKKLEGTNPPGIMAYLRTLRAVYKEAQKRVSLNIKKDNPFLGVIKTYSKKSIDEVKLADFKKLKNYTPKKSTTKLNAYKMQRTIDLWLFQVAIGGHDFADLSILKWKDVDKRIKFKRFKNRNKPKSVFVDNKLSKFALSIIEKYGTNKDKRLFSFIPSAENELKYSNYRNNYNRSLRTISKDLELTSILKSKTPRYVFRSLAGEMLLNTLVIMQIQGHKPVGVSFGYQTSLPYKVVDKQHKKLLKKAGLNK